MMKTNLGNFFEDFSVGQVIAHATPKTVTSGDVALYTGLYGSRFAVQSSRALAQAIGYRDAPVDDLLVFHTVFGKTVPDISLNAVANLGYAECRFLAPVYPGDTLSAVSEVIGLKQNSNGKTGVVYVRSRGVNQDGQTVLEFVRWVMVRKRDETAPAPTEIVPTLRDGVAAGELGSALPALSLSAYDDVLAGSPHRFGDYQVGEKIDHVDAMTLEEAEHQIATRLYQNTAKVHFNLHEQSQGRFGARLIYGGCRDFTGPGTVLQRTWQCLSRCRNQWGAARCADFGGRYDLCLERGAGYSCGHRGTRQRRRFAFADCCDEEPAVYRVSKTRGRG